MNDIKTCSPLAIDDRIHSTGANPLSVTEHQIPSIEIKDVVFKCAVRDSTFLTPPLNATFYQGERVALISSNRKIRSQLISLLYGLIKPESGEIVPYGSVSWPLGLKGGLDSRLTLKQNMRFLVGLYPDRLAPLDWDRFLAAFLQVLNLSPDQPLKTLRSKEQRLFFMVVSLAFSFDTFLLPSAFFMQGSEKERLYQYFKKVFDARIEDQCLVTTSINRKFLKQYCQRGLVVDNSGSIAFEGGVEDCFAWLKSQSSASPDEDDSMDESTFNQELDNEDVDPSLYDII